MRIGQLDVSQERLAAFCRKWRITEFSLFGSVLREDFRPDSDVDVLVSFAEGTHLRLADWGRLDEELKALFGRDVDLVERSAVERSENYIRRREILQSAEVLYAT